MALGRNLGRWYCLIDHQSVGWEKDINLKSPSSSYRFCMHKSAEDPQQRIAARKEASDFGVNKVVLERRSYFEACNPYRALDV